MGCWAAHFRCAVLCCIRRYTYDLSEIGRVSVGDEFSECKD